MKTKLVIASVATFAALASMGSAFAGELYSANEGSYTSIMSSKPATMAAFDASGELHGAVERQTEQFMARKAASSATPAAYALGGQLLNPHNFGAINRIDSNLAE